MIAAVTIVAGGAFALAGCIKPPPPPPPGHCITPSGFDLNAEHGVEEPIVTHFCTQVPEETRWRANARWVTASTHEVVPPGYQPTAEKPIEDFNNKFVGAKYVVDPGTARERTYVFGDQELKHLLPPDAHVWLSPRLHGLAEGTHVVDLYITLTAEHWDGLAANPAENRLPAGESLFDQYQFEVDDPD